MPRLILFISITFFCQASFAIAASCQVGSSTHATIQSAVDDSACNPVLIPSGTYTENVIISRNLRVRGSGQNQTIVDGNASGSVFAIASGANVLIRDLAVQNGRASEGGGIHSKGILALKRVIVRANTATQSGGGIFTSNSFAAVAITVKGNAANVNYGKSGGIYCEGASLVSIAASNISGNQSSFLGAIHLQSVDKAIIKDTTITRNSPAGITLPNLVSGITPTYLRMKDSTLGSNKPAGGIFVGSSASVVIESSTVAGNTQLNTTSCGAGIRNDGTMVIIETNIQGNIASSCGGGVGNIGNMLISKSNIQNNSVDSSLSPSPVAQPMGGGISNGSGSLFIDKSAIIENSSSGFGGGVVQYAGNGSMWMTNSTISNNQATKKGGGIAFFSSGIARSTSKVMLEHVTIAENWGKEGGGIFTKKVHRIWPELTLKNTAVGKNQHLDCKGKGIVSLGHNLDSDGTCALQTTLLDIPMTDPEIGPLTTGFHLPLSCTSPLVDRADSTFRMDQRGEPRPFPCTTMEGERDIGAIELQPEDIEGTN